MKTTSILKTIIGGILLGAFVFFTGPLLLIILVLKFIFTPFGMGRYYHSSFGFGGMHGEPRLAFADKVRGMSDEDYTAFKTKFEGRHHGHCC